MADNILVQQSNIQQLLKDLPTAFPLTRSLATINGASLVNGGSDILIPGRRDVLFFNGNVTLSTVEQSGISAASYIAWSPIYKTFVAFSTSTLKFHNAWSTEDAVCGIDTEWGVPTPNGFTPHKDKLYVDYRGRKFYRWNGTDLVNIGVDTELFKYVDKLPTASADTLGTIYMVAPGGQEHEGNALVEWVTVTADGQTYIWEKLGEYQPTVDLSDYVTTSTLNSRLSSYYTIAQAAAMFLSQTNARSLYMDKATYGYTLMTDAEVTALVQSILG